MKSKATPQACSKSFVRIKKISPRSVTLLCCLVFASSLSRADSPRYGIGSIDDYGQYPYIYTAFPQGADGYNGSNSYWGSTPGGGGDGSTPAADVQSIDNTTLTDSVGTPYNWYYDSIVAKSQGGAGGAGGNGDATLGINGRTGGAGGAGGDLNYTFNPSWYISPECNQIWGTNETVCTGGGTMSAPTGAATATAIWLQSIGGKGGDGGSNGGNGGAGGVGGSVSIVNGVAYPGLQASYAYGILAQSLGGWGGSGGDSTSWWYSNDGGSGSVGASGGSVNVQNTGQLYSQTAYPIFAQSMGGNGGSGGSGSGTFLYAGNGGDGGYGGDGGSVTVSNAGNLFSGMTGGAGIFAQSVGGGGGAAGSDAGLFSLGGSGGYAAAGQNVSVTNSGFIVLQGLSAVGIYAQSFGGGGGSGGMANGLYAIGGSGGGGGAAGQVAVYNSGPVFTGGSCLSIDSSGACTQISTQSQSPSLYSNGGAFGILAQSIGGGGGNGGFGLSSNDMVPTAGLALGGTGGDGGKGSNVYVNNTNSIYTLEANSAGVLAQSIGGGGGSGGGSVSVGLGFISSYGISTGGDGGSGGSAGFVGVNCPISNASAACEDSGSTINAPVAGFTIQTAGVGSPGIAAQSIGGGGGIGGYAVSLTAAAAGGSVSSSFGGKGGNGGSASDVYLSPAGINIVTSGQDSPGLIASSVGGGGGSGGTTVSGTANGYGIAASLSMGGSGGAGGTGYGSAIENFMAHDGSNVPAASITTYGDRSHGIIGQSVGGGGGSGGSSISLSGADGIALGYSIGGSGGNGGDAGVVGIFNDGVIRTSGNYSSAISGQSIGGGGGNGGISIGTAASSYLSGTQTIGGGGAIGGNAGNVTINNYGSLTTTGGGHPALLAQSVGGGGGSGGLAYSGLLSMNGYAIAVGGKGTTGGNAGSVNVVNTADINSGSLTTQTESNGVVTIQKNTSNNPGILAQSIGGGGGNAGYSVGAVLADLAAGLSIGSSGGAGGSSKSVTLNNSGNIWAAGDLSGGIIAQSMGGNGGNGGLAISGALSGTAAMTTSLGGDGGDGGQSAEINLTSTGQISTYGFLSSGVVVQSVGGAGGNGGMVVAGGVTSSASMTVSLGGSAGSGGVAGDVTASIAGVVLAQGSQSSGVIAQSIGGSGGNGGNAFAGSLTKGIGLGATVTLGNSGGDGGKSGVVNLTVGDISTNGLMSTAVLAQSIGGNGGNGGSSSALTIGTPIAADSFSASVAVGGLGGSGATANTVNVNHVGNVSTKGEVADNSIGILAQSIGGSGGNGGNATSNAIAGGGTISMSVGGNGGVGANSDGAVNVWSNDGLSTGGITTSGMNSVAIMAQSIGGGGGNGGWAMSSSTSNRYASGSAIGGWGADGGYATYVNVYSGGTLSTTGMQSSGIVAQSIGGGGGNGGSSSSQVSASPGSAADGVTAVVGSTVANLGGNNAAVNAATWASRNAQDQLSSTDDMPNDGVSGSMAVGGLGGTGGTGGAVSVSSISTIITTGAMSNGIVAQSIGGGGGNGGDSTSGADGGKYSAAISVGGYGASGGTSGEVLVNNSGYISTTGNHAIGIYAQSIGGGGGSGGSSAASSTAAAGGAAAVSMGIGGWGAYGGTGGMVTVNNNGSILTSGIKSAGIYAQSIGGGGGNGGSSTVSSEVAAAESDSGPSSAGTGGTSAPSTSNDSNSSTAGNTASGQNTSAAGADKGTAIGLSIGGFGGQGGIANDVFVTNTGIIITGYQSTSANSLAYADLGLSDGSVGIFAQSVGGGGGDGGSTTSNADGSKNSVSLALGGFGGTGGDGRDVGVSNFGTVITYGHNSTAIFAQSVGGGGGNGGASSVTSGSGGSNAVAIGLGGRGGAAGSGSSVSVTNSGSIATYGALSYGVLAQSVGGGGGNGGDVSVSSTAGTSSDSGEDNAATANSDGSTSSEAKSGVSVAASLGGAGGAGGTAGIVTITNTGSISTAGIGSTAVIAQSIGGGGGNSGASSSESNGGAYNANLSLGMKGGSGGAGNTVNVNSTGSISTAGANAMGIFAQSVGGGGGNATSNSASSSGSSGKAGVAMSMGANGGSGNTGGTVNLSLNGTVSTSGVNAIGIFAQSVGGGGGNGATSQSSANGGDAAVALSLGGTGGSGGTSGAVNVYAIQSVSTKGANAQGIFAQSIGGGGGNGGSSSSTSGDGGSFNANLTLGGSGTTGANADAVLVSTNVADYNSANSTSIIAPSNQSISTAGVNAQGILAQSVGGGGGNGGDSSSLTNNADNNTKTKMVGLSLGGKAGAGGNGGTVTVNNALSIGTTGAYSQAISAQSIGGGGGNGGSSSSGPADNASTFNLALGANGGSGGNGGLVFVTSTGSLSTTGLNASALVAQSIAGGGGAAGATDNNSFGFASSTVNSVLGATNGTSGLAGTVSITTSGNSITTSGHNSMGIVGQSINGGGGISNASLTYTSGTVNYQATLGGSGVTNASANEVTINSSNAISTTGANAVGIMAQSVGGGGGVSTTTITGGSVSMDPVTIGGQSSTSGNGLAVNVTQTGEISTSGAAAIGIVAQSVGGGGGYAALASLNANTTLTNPTNVTIGGSGGSSGNGGEVNVTVGAPITTHGNNAVGVIAQSVGGGGGILLTSGLSAGVTPTFSGGTGNGGNVTVNVNAPISIYGAGVYGVIAQSIGGGGGMVISESGVVDGSGKGGGEGGIVTVNVNSLIYVNGYTTSNAIVTSTNGASAYGVYAKSIGTSDPNVTVSSGASVIAAGGAAAIVVDGLVNTVTNNGLISASNLSTDKAIQIVNPDGNSQIVNNGTMVGAVTNQGGRLNILNSQAARMYLPNAPGLGQGGSFTNSGYLQLVPSGFRTTAQNILSGKIEQTATGILGFKLDFKAVASDAFHFVNSLDASQTDALVHVKLAGNLQPILLNPGLIAPGTIQKSIVTKGLGTNVNDEELGIFSTAIMNFDLIKTRSSIGLVATANFAPAGLSQFGSQVGQAIGTNQTAGSNAFFQAATAQLVMQPDVPTLDQAYQGLAGTAIQSVSQSVFQAVNQGIGSYTDRMNDWRISTATSKASLTASFNQPLYAMNNSNAMTDAVLDSNSYLPAGRSGPWISFFQSNVFSNSLNDRVFGGSAAYEVESDQHDKMGGVGVTISQSGYSYNSAPTPITPGTSTNVGLSVYGIGRGESAYLSGIAYLGGGNTNFTRQLQTMAFNTSTNVNVMSYVAAGRIEAGYAFNPFRNEYSNLQITPFAAVQPTYIHQKSASENFSGLGSGFNYSATDNTAVPVFIGLELSGNHMTDSGTKISPFIRASWMAETQQKGQMGASYNGQGVNLYFNGTPNLGNAMLYKVGSVFTANEKISGYFTLDYDYGNAAYAYRNYGTSFGMKYAF